MAGYNEDLCKRIHMEIEARLNKGEVRMDAHETMLINHDRRIAVMDENDNRNKSLMLKTLTPIIQIITTVASGMILAYLLRG